MEEVYSDAEEDYEFEEEYVDDVNSEGGPNESVDSHRSDDR